MKNSSYADYKENDNIIPISLKRKEQYYRDLTNLDYSWTGRLDALFSNTFFKEAVQLIVNSIVVFDCAFYSLRQSLEISTTTVYFVDDTEENRKAMMRKWKTQDKFPGHKQMHEALKNRAKDFADIKSKMSAYFTQLNEVKRRLDKYVHKQGFDNLLRSTKPSCS